MAVQHSRSDAWMTTVGEISRVGTELDADEYEEFSSQFDQLDAQHRVFFSGQGRSGLAAQMVAMRFMHMGLQAHVIGEATAPSIQRGDTLVLISGSGRTPVSLNFGAVAKSVGARLWAVTHQSSSELRSMADATLVVPAAESSQFGGTLFEESALMVLDSIVLDQMRRRDVDHAVMSARHTNFL